MTLSEAMSNFRGRHMANHGTLTPLNETSSIHILQAHADTGYVVISACRGTNTVQENNRLTRELEDDIRATRFSYTPVYGGFIEDKGLPTERQVYEASFIIYCKHRGGADGDADELFEFGLSLCRKYDQDSFLFKAPADVPKYYDQLGKVEMEFDGNPSIGDVTQEYFTSLSKTDMKNDRFTFTESYLAPKPETYGERHVRHLSGEVF